MGIFTFSFVSRTQAQSDSVVLTLHFATPMSTYGFITMVANIHDSIWYGPYYSGSIDLRIDTSIVIPMDDSINIRIGKSDVECFIDSSAGLLRNLAFLCQGSVGGTTGSAGEAGSGLWQDTIKIDSSAFSRAGSAIIVSPSVIEGTYSWEAYWTSDPFLYPKEGGGEFGNGAQEDTLSMELSPAVSSVFSAKTLEPQEFSIAMDGEGFCIATFSPKPMERQLDLVSLLGSKMISIPIYSECSSMQLPEAILPPGLYFARLGNEIAKFIVMQ